MSESARPFRLLVVDDEKDIRDTLPDMLLRCVGLPIAVDVAESGEAGLTWTEKSYYDLVLSDFRMPGMGGLAFLQKVHEASPTTLTVLLTAYPDVNLAVKAINDVNVSAFLPKPFDVPEISRRVKALLEGKRAKEQRAQATARTVEL